MKKIKDKKNLEKIELEKLIKRLRRAFEAQKKEVLEYFVKIDHIIDNMEKENDEV